ncbi:methyltransferase [Kitasatospora sp. NPDC050467]|uniref:methyltransferase n=1 Tax=Kitasatospora sp. NPDC050467 TaxID=3364053 RepID=UPI00379868EA
MPAIPALVSALRTLGDRPAVVAGGRAISGIGLLLGVAPQGGLPEAVAERVAAHAALPAAESAQAERRLRHWAGVLGPPPIRHTVLYPATELGIELALATLLAGGTVICGDPDQPADQLPAQLEQSGTTHLSLPSELLWRLSRVTTLRGTDLAALRQVLHVGPEPAQGDVYAAMDALGAVVAHVRPPHSEAELADHRLREVVGAAADTAWKQAIGVTAGQARLFVERLDDAVLLSMLSALQSAGVLNDPAGGHPRAEIPDAARVAPEHRPLAARWLRALVREQSVTLRGEHVHGARPVDDATAHTAWEHAAEAWTGHLGAAAVIDHLRRGAAHLPGLLSGEQPAGRLFRPDGSAGGIDALTRSTATGRYLGSALGSAVRHIATAHRGRRPLRLLELGAGTGAATEAIADALAAACGAVHPLDYLCTEPSGVLLDAARARLRRHPWLRFGLLDPHGGPGTAEPGPVDVVVSTGVLGGARDAADRARRLAGLLTPGGWLLAVEPTREHLDRLITRDFLAPSPAAHAGPPSRQGWLDVLAAAGFGSALTLPGEDHPLTLLGYHLFVARTP